MQKCGRDGSRSDKIFVQPCIATFSAASSARCSNSALRFSSKFAKTVLAICTIVSVRSLTHTARSWRTCFGMLSRYPSIEDDNLRNEVNDELVANEKTNYVNRLFIRLRVQEPSVRAGGPSPGGKIQPTTAWCPGRICDFQRAVEIPHLHRIL